MHELSISRAVLELATRAAQGRRVVLVNVTIGALRQVVPDSLEFCFEAVSRETVCDGARLRPRVATARLLCSCGHRWQLEQPSFRCPRCGGAQVSVIDGDQLTVDSIEVEEAPCTEPR